MTNPFRIEPPAMISFSGGRTSAAMLRFILNAYGVGEDGGIPEGVHVMFANTGKERPETLDFVHELEERWAVDVEWLEYRPGVADAPDGFERVNYTRASRNGEPFDALIRKRNFLPNPTMRFCTTELKIRVMKKAMLAHGYDAWTNVVGLRADEPGRVARQRATNDAGKEVWTNVWPLFEAGITKAQVMDFWAAQPFDLRLQPWEGNCDLCFLKGRYRKMRVIRDDPSRAAWWVAKEEQLVGIAKPSAALFRADAPSYKKMVEMVRSQPLLPGLDDDDGGPEDQSIDCYCTD